MPARRRRRAKELRLLAAELPPYTFQMPPASVAETPGVEQGLVYEVVSEMAKRVGHSGLIEFMPWGEAQRIAQTQPNIGILALTRSPSGRINTAGWQSIVTDDLILVGGAGHRRRPPRQGQGPPGRRAQPFWRRSAAQGARLHAHPAAARGVAERAPDAAARIDAWLAPRLMVIYAMREVGGNLEALNFGEIVRRARSISPPRKTCPTPRRRNGSKALEAVKADGTYQRIADQYNR
jgi:polar amino acid transport system substrate-binding protein